MREFATRSLEPLVPSGERLPIEGHALELKPRAAIVLSQVLCELATSAANYGALSHDGDGPISDRSRRWSNALLGR